MKALLVAMLVSLSPALAQENDAPRIDMLPTVEVPETINPDLISPTIVQHKGKTYLCGSINRSDRHDPARFVVLIEFKNGQFDTSYWQIHEPSPDEETWEGFDSTYTEICEAGE